MNYACPHCQCDLAKSKPLAAALKGERKFLPLRTALACPKCGGHLQFNLHPLERAVHIVDALLFLALVAVSLLANDERYFFAGVAFGGLTEVALWFYLKTSLYAWSRYASLT